MKQLHKQSSSAYKRDEELGSAQSYLPKSTKHHRTLPRSLNYILKEQRLVFIIIGILIGSVFFIFQPTFLSSHESNNIVRKFRQTPLTEKINFGSEFDSESENVVDDHNRDVGVGLNDGGGSDDGKDVNFMSGNGRIPVGIRRKRLRIVVTGGSGFVGSHLVDKLIGRGDEVIVIDNFFTGRKENVVHHFGNPRFELIRHDVVEPILLEVDQIYHLACPASPVHYKYNPVKTIKTNVMGTLNMLGLAKRIGARLLLTSTSEVYGDPLEHPQKETYWGNVNPIGERSCYDEGKRVAETLAMDYHRGAGVEVRIARIFNTYGPRMCLDDGRVVSNFVAQAIRKQPMTVYGDGQQTRSFQYVSDLVDGLVALMEGEHVGPFNLGNPETTMLSCRGSQGCNRSKRYS
ncbi:hypothetical protein Leryth_011692 [Lithospermum erythrorhizon]|nr:hypothetical protein Leryth_011692 [Lithospermum erythrorhizon]